MGGDHGPSEIIPATLFLLKKYPDLNLILVGVEAVLLAELANHDGQDHPRLTVLHAPEVIEMNESPSLALRHKKQSSMRLSIEQVRDGHAGACVSAGNTGALMAISRFVLKMLPGIERPAICTTLPSKRGHVHVLDLGANIDASSEQLFQFAIMGTQLTSAVENKESPTIGLLNVGEEDNKGNDRVKQAAALLTNSDLNYIGYVEGTDLYMGDIDVIVCDGFVGNIMLKASEGLMQFVGYHATNEFKRNLYTKFAAMISMPVLKSLKNRMDPRHYNGASLLGLRGIVIKSHGSAERVSFARAIEEAMREIENNVPEKINLQLEQIFIDRQT